MGAITTTATTTTTTTTRLMRARRRRTTIATATVITTIAKDEGYSVEEKTLTKEDIQDADEAFFTGTASEVTPIISLDDRKINNGEIGKITSQLKKLYMAIVFAKSEPHLSWLTFIK